MIRSSEVFKNRNSHVSNMSLEQKSRVKTLPKSGGRIQMRPKSEDPLQPIRQRGTDKLIECWINRQPTCFWDNFWWLYFQTQYIRCDARYGPSKDATCGTLTPGSIEKTKCENRRIFSGYCNVNDAWYINSPEKGQRIYCKNAPIIELAKNCTNACGALPDSQKKVEAGGCDGYTAWCWCNSNTGGGVIQGNQNSHCTCLSRDEGGQCTSLDCGSEV
jgi:hypothetical protein